MEIIDSLWATTNEEIGYKNIHDFTGKACDMIMKQSLEAGSTENLTCIVIGFKNFKNFIKN